MFTDYTNNFLSLGTYGENLWVFVHTTCPGLMQLVLFSNISYIHVIDQAYNFSFFS